MDSRLISQIRMSSALQGLGGEQARDVPGLTLPPEAYSEIERIDDALIENYLAARLQHKLDLPGACSGRILVYRKLLSLYDQMWRGETDILNDADCPHCHCWIASGSQLRDWYPHDTDLEITLLAWIPPGKILEMQTALSVSYGSALCWAEDDDSQTPRLISSLVKQHFS